MSLAIFAAGFALGVVLARFVLQPYLYRWWHQ